MSTSLVSVAPSPASQEAGAAVCSRHPLRRRYLLGRKRGWPLSVGVTYLALFGMLALNSCVNQKNVTAEEAPLSEDAIVRLADKMRSQGDVTMAADFYQRALERDANNIPAYLGLASLHEQMGQPEQAGRYYLEAIRRDGRNMNTRRAYARLLMTQEQFGAATEQYQTALSSDGDDVRARNGIGVAFDQQGQHAKAQEHYRQVLAREPENMTALNNLGLSLLATGDAAGAIAALAPAADSLKLTPALRQNLALAYVITGQDAMALGLLRRDLGAAEAGRILAQLRKQQRAGIKPVSQVRSATPSPRTVTAMEPEVETPEAVPTTPVVSTPDLMLESTAAAPVAVKKPLNPLVAEIAANANMPAGIVLTADEGAHPDASPAAASPDATRRVQAVAIAKPLPKPVVAPQLAEVKTAPPPESAAAPPPKPVAPLSTKLAVAKPRLTPPAAKSSVMAARAVAAPVAAVKAPEPRPMQTVLAGKREQSVSTRPLLARAPAAPPPARSASSLAVVAGSGTSALVGPFATGAMADVQRATIRSKFSGYLPEKPTLNVKTSLSASGTPQFVVHVYGFAKADDAEDFCDHLQRRDYPCAAQ